MSRWLSGVLLAWIALCFVGYSASLVPHLVNNSFADIEFTGWSGPIGARIAAGERPYVDFVLPIPPGSLALLALVGKLAGRPLLIEELWLNAICHLCMGLLAYAIAVRFASRAIALGVATLSLVSVVTFNKECAYNHTAQVFAWACIAVGARALLAGPGRRRRLLWVATGTLAALVTAFKQSTAIGGVLGWLAANAYLGCFAWLSGRREYLRAVALDALAFGAGVVAGALPVVALVLSLGSTLSAFWQAVFVDGPHLKGGTGVLVHNLFNYVFVDTAFPASVGGLAALIYVGARIQRFEGTLHVGGEAARDPAPDRRTALAIALGTAVVFGVAIAMLWTPGAVLTPPFVSFFDRARRLATFGLGLTAAFFVVHARRLDHADEAATRTGHALNALAIASLVISLLHNTSAPELRAFYDNNPIIPLAWLYLLTALRRARLPWAVVLAFALGCSTLFGNKLARALVARTTVGSQGYWAGMKVSEGGADMVRAALRVRELTTADDSVLVLPEDVDFVALIDRPRPRIRGAIVFVDQYPRRLADADIAELRRHPPKVIVLHPAEQLDWQQIFRIWSGDSGAERIMRFALGELLPRRYRLDRRVATRFLGHAATLEIWVRR